MPVTNSTYSADAHTQADGRRYVTETHTLNVGGPEVRTYLAAVGADYQSIMNARVPRINEALASAEFYQTVLRDPAAISLAHQTAAEFADRFWSHVRAAYQSGSMIEYGRLLWWVYEMVLGGWLTSTQVRNSYNAAYGKSLNSTQWNALVSSRIQPAHDRYAALMAEGDL